MIGARTARLLRSNAGQRDSSLIGFDAMRQFCLSLSAAAAFAAWGCGGATPQPASQPAPPSVTAESAPPEDPDVATAEPAPSFEPILLGDDTAANTSSTSPPSGSQSGAGEAAGGTAPAANREALLSAMMPVQIMLGTWRGITQREIGDFKGIDQPEWVWDFQTDRDQPAMVMESAEGAYFREARLTYDVAQQVFRLTTTDSEAAQRAFEGNFTQTPQDVQGDDKKLHRTYKLELTEVEPVDPKDQWQVVFNHQENNRYLMELYRKTGSTFRRFETVATQREGTSFALNDEDYGERTCVISGGLGTIQVSYEGKSYWVCCTGCQAAFNEDPVTWIAEFEAKQMDEK